MFSSTDTVTDSACYVPRTHIISLPQYVDFKSRLATYKEVWPKYLPEPSISNLARSGFVYLAVGDRVKWFSCGIIVKYWEPTDCAYGEHYRWPKTCPYLRMIAYKQLLFKMHFYRFLRVRSEKEMFVFSNQHETVLKPISNDFDSLEGTWEDYKVC